MRIDRHAATPLYYQIEQDILTHIRNKKLKPGDLLPTEKDLQQRYNVSRTTIRLALNSLYQKGLIVRLPGKGTFVARPRILHTIGTITSFTDEMNALGICPSTRILRFERLKPPLHIAESLQIDPHDPVILFQRLRFANEEPVAISTIYLPEDLVPGFLERGPEGESFYRFLETHYQLVFTETDETVEATLLAGEEAELLAVSNGFPALLVGRITCVENNRALERSYTVYRGDKFTYHAKLRGRVDHNDQGR